MFTIRKQTIYLPVCNTSKCGLWVESNTVPSGDSDKKTNDDPVALKVGCRLSEEKDSLIRGQRVQ